MAVEVLDTEITNSFTSNGHRFVVRHDPRRATTTILSATCKHRGGPINLGHFEDGVIVCPWHGYKTRCPAAGSRKSPFVFVRSGWRVTVIGASIETTRHLPVPKRNEVAG